MEDKIKKLSKKDINIGREILGKAFFDDPVFIYVIPDNKGREKKMKYIFKMMISLGVRYGETYATSNLEGIVIWLPFKKYKQKIIRFIRCGAISLIFRLGIKTLKKFLIIDELNKKAHLQYAPNEHWYIVNIGIDPKYQGKGFGSMLMRHMIEKIDNQRLPIYLETLTEININFYKKFRFKVMGNLIIPGTNIREYFMLRES